MPAIDYEAAANAFLIFVTGLLGYFGIRKGFRTSAAEGDVKPLKLDMAMVDNRAIEALAISVETLNTTMRETNRLMANEAREREIEDEVERRLKERER